ncbi:MAG: methanol oxidation system protein MoxJ [Hyphomicrobiaceae bacterium]
MSLDSKARALIAHRTRKPIAVALAAGLLISGSLAVAAEEKADQQAVDPSILRICAAANEHPYSTRDGKGFENKIAEVIAAAMGRTPVYAWHNKPAIYLVRDKLNMKVCDVVLGVDTSDERLTTTKPYYRAPYVFVERKDSKLSIDGWGSPDLVKANKIGFTPGSPAQVMLTKLDLYSVHFNYVASLTNFKSRRNQYTRIDPVRLVGEVADGTADLSIAFAPEVARYVKGNPALKMVVIPDDNVRIDGEKVPHHFDQSIGVRKGEDKLAAALNEAIEKAQPQIQQILKDEGIPLLKPGTRS